MFRRPKTPSPRATPILITVLAASLLSPTALARKGKKKKSSEPAAPEGSAAVTPEVPDDATSRRFAKGLIAAQIRDFSPTDATTGATFVYERMSFEPDNTWNSSGYIEVMDDRMECTESGHWSMEPATSPTEATVTWKVDKTDCPGREAGEQVRAVVKLLDDGGIDVIFH